MFSKKILAALIGVVVASSVVATGQGTALAADTSHQTSFSCKPVPNSRYFYVTATAVLPVGLYWADTQYDWQSYGDSSANSGSGTFDKNGVAHVSDTLFADQKAGAATLQILGYNRHSVYGTLAETSLQWSCGLVPIVTAISPNHGPAKGGNSVAITGKRLMQVTRVTFGGVSATNIVHLSRTELKVIAPAHPGGKVNVRVRHGLRISRNVSADNYTYTAPV